jgi:hypothetical protein
MIRFIKVYCCTLLLTFTLPFVYGQTRDQRICFEFYEGTFNGEIDKALLVDIPAQLTPQKIKSFYETVNACNYQPIIDSLTAYKQKHQLSDWLYYQLIRKTAQQISPKADNYSRYTLYKWFLLAKSGYDARLALTSSKVIFYVFNNEDVEDIPSFTVDHKKYMCLNYHDYAKTNLNLDPPIPVTVNIPEATKPFSYRITKMPNFKPEDYFDKELQFTYHHKVYYFNVKLNRDVEAIFANYPIVDFESYFNIPLSKETYGSLIPLLKKNVKGMNQKKGVDYLMRFTRYAFLYEDDEDNFGKEKRLSPEETLFAKYSDCDDRAALFFYLVKEVYNLPMIALLYPTHITMAVQFDKPIGSPIIYKGKTYSLCEPTPQREDLGIGQVSAKLRNKPYEVVYQYVPDNKQ